MSLDLYRDTVLKALAGTTRPAVLAGRSFGGITISAVAEAAPEKVETLVYVAAYLPRDGESLGPPQLRAALPDLILDEPLAPLATPVRSATTLATGHTPFLTDPAGLAKAIEDAAR